MLPESTPPWAFEKVWITAQGNLVTVLRASNRNKAATVAPMPAAIPLFSVRCLAIEASNNAIGTMETTSAANRSPDEEDDHRSEDRSDKPRWGKFDTPSGY
jgi:hypothetical protein